MISHSESLDVGGNKVEYILNDGSGANKPDFEVEIINADDSEEINEKIAKKLSDEVWSLNPKFKKEDLVEHFGIKLDSRVVDVYNFAEPLSEVERGSIIRTISRLYEMLPDKSLWRLESIQITHEKELNLKGGSFIRGREYVKQNRFEIYPQGRADNKYREGELLCSELQGVVTHEVTHVVFEELLEKNWNSPELGWVRTNDFRVELPGGMRSGSYNRLWKECPTSYASLTEADDRAESMVAYLFAPESLHEKRKSILDKILLKHSEEKVYPIVELPLEIPKFGRPLNINIVPSKIPGLFGTVTLKKSETPSPVITLEDLRKKLLA